MPLPWKKKKVARISNFVADLHSPKRGSSLVVQTGFPTSLIDLFVKNRARFNKPRPKKRPPHEIHDPPPPEPTDLSGRSLPRAGPTCPEASSSSSKRLVRNGDDGVTGSEVYGRLGKRIGESNSDPNKVIAAILKMLVVLAVTLSVEKLTFGITISAFVLLFLEFAGKHVVSWFKPCSNAIMSFKYFARRVSSCVWYQNLVSVMGKRQSCEGLPEPPSLVRGKIEVQFTSGSSTRDEIEIVEPKSETGTENRYEEICFLGSELNSFYEENKGAGSEIEEVCEITQDKTRSKRSGKLKSKIVKRLVPKKLRGLKKGKRTKDREEIEKLSKEKEAESCSEVPSSVEGDESAIFEIEEEGEEGMEGQENWSKLERIADEEVDCGITGSNLEVEGESNGQEQEQERIDRGGGSESGALMLFVVALAGLVVGRLIAFLLAVTWMFMLKILKSRGRSLNVHVVKCCEHISS